MEIIELNVQCHLPLVVPWLTPDRERFGCFRINALAGYVVPDASCEADRTTTVGRIARRPWFSHSLHSFLDVNPT